MFPVRLFVKPSCAGWWYLAQIDTDGSGSISFSELSTWWTVRARHRHMLRAAAGDGRSERRKADDDPVAVGGWGEEEAAAAEKEKDEVLGAGIKQLIGELDAEGTGELGPGELRMLLEELLVDSEPTRVWSGPHGDPTVAEIW